MPHKIEETSFAFPLLLINFMKRDTSDSFAKRSLEFIYNI